MANDNVEVKNKPIKLFDRIGNYFDGRHANGHEGLVLLDESIRRTASKDRDWDALARFVSRANGSNNAAKVKKIIRAAFGNQISFALDKKHPAGGKFTLGWDGPFPLAGSNSYTLVKKAIAEGKSWDDKDFLKKLSDVVPDVVKPKRLVNSEEQTKVAKHLATYLAERVAEGFSSGDIIREMQALLADMKKAPKEAVVYELEAKAS